MLSLNSGVSSKKVKTGYVSQIVYNTVDEEKNIYNIYGISTIQCLIDHGSI